MAMLITTHHLELWDTTNAQVKLYMFVSKWQVKLLLIAVLTSSFIAYTE
jgi:hypothetical protein